MRSTHENYASGGIYDGREVIHALCSGFVGMKKGGFDDKASKAMNDEDKWSAGFISVSSIRQVCAEIGGMLLNRVVRDDAKRPLVNNIGIVSPCCYSRCWDAGFRVGKEILRPKTCILLSWISRPCSLAVAS